jgi:hypothetical protein
MTILNKYLLTNVLRRPDDEQGSDVDGGEDTTATLDALKATLAFDPATFFAPPADEGAGGEAKQEGEAGEATPKPSGEKAASQSPEGTPAAKPSDQGTKDEGDPLAELRASVKQFLTAKPEPAKPEAKPEATPQPTPQGREAPQGEEIKYDFQVPVELVDALGAEEPATRVKAVNALVNTLANKLAKDFGSAMAAMAQHVRDEAVRQAVSSVQAARSQEDVRQEFYRDHPDLAEMAASLPGFDATIWSTAQAVAQHAKAQSWSKELGDQTANLVRVSLGIPPKGAAPKPPADPAKQPAKPRVPWSAGGGNGASGRQNGASGHNEFSEVVFGAGS